MDRIAEIVRELDTGEAFVLSEADGTRLDELLRLAGGGTPLDRDAVETRTTRGKLLARLARAVSLAAADDADHAGQVLDEFCREAADHDGADALLLVADRLAAAGARLDPLPVRLYGLHRSGDDARLTEALAGADDRRIPHSVLADAAVLTDDAGDHARAARLADRAIAYHVRRREPEPAFLAWMVAEASGEAGLGTLLRYLKSLYELDPAQVAQNARTLAWREAEAGRQDEVLRVLRTAVRLTAAVPDYFVKVIQRAFPEGHAIGGRFDMLDEWVHVKEKDPLAHVETVLRFLPGRFVYINGKMVARIRETDGRVIRLEGPKGERFEETYDRDAFHLLDEGDYRVRLRYAPDEVREWVRDRPLDFVQHIIAANNGQIVDDQLREELTAIMSRKAFDAWLESTRELLKKERKLGVEFSARTMSFQVRQPPKKKPVPEEDE